MVGRWVYDLKFRKSQLINNRGFSVCGRDWLNRKQDEGKVSKKRTRERKMNLKTSFRTQSCCFGLFLFLLLVPSIVVLRCQPRKKQFSKKSFNGLNQGSKPTYCIGWLG